MSKRLLKITWNTRPKLVRILAVIGLLVILNGWYFYKNSKFLEFYFSLITFISVFLGIILSFEYERIRNKITIENEVGRISPLIEIELLTNHRTLKIWIINMKDDNTIKGKDKLYLNYWDIYKDIIRNWGAPNMIRLREIYLLSEQINDSIVLEDINKYLNRLNKLDELITHHLNAVDKWYNDEKAPTNYIKYSLRALKEYKNINIDYLDEIIVEREKYFNNILKNHCNYYEELDSNKKKHNDLNEKEINFVWQSIILFFSVALSFSLSIANSVSNIFKLGDLFFYYIINKVIPEPQIIISTLIYCIFICLNIIYVGYIWKKSYLNKFRFYESLIIGIIFVGTSPMYLYYFMLFIFERIISKLFN